MYTKGSVVNDAYKELRIWGITTTPTPEEVQTALSRLDELMAAYDGQNNFTINYNFELTPNINSPTGTPFQFKRMMVKNLAVELIPTFGKEVPPALMAQAGKSYEDALGLVQMTKLQQIQPPRRMPLGNGNTFRGLFWNRYMVPVQLPPNTPQTKYIVQGETMDYYEDYSAWLESNTIASFTIDVDPLLTLDTSANASPLITYRLTAPAQVTNYGPWQQVQITVTDSIGRVTIRTLNFIVITPPVVG